MNADPLHGEGDFIVTLVDPGLRKWAVGTLHPRAEAFATVEQAGAAASTYQQTLRVRTAVQRRPSPEEWDSYAGTMLVRVDGASAKYQAGAA